MRSLRLARIAAQAELLRLRRLARRQVSRAVLGAIAAVFLLAFLATLHFSYFFALRYAHIAPVYDTLIVAGTDLLIALVFALFAMRNTPGRLEREASELRHRAQAQLVQEAAVGALVGPVLRALGVRRLYAAALAALAARFLGTARQ